MKKIFLLLLILSLLSASISFAQVIQGKSSKQTYNIKKTESTEKSGSDKDYYNIKKKDEIPPTLKIISPEFDENKHIETEDKLLAVKGHVEDESGVFEVLVNNVEAMVDEEGNFLARVPMAIGENTIQIKATDIHYNTETFVFKVVRKTASNILAEDNRSLEIDNLSISWENPKSSNMQVSSKNFDLRACVNSKEDILKVQLFVNGKLIRELNKEEVVFRTECKYLVTETLQLNEGENLVKISAYTASGEVSSETRIIYDFIAAKYYALVIGVEDYLDDEIKDLDNPIKDAQSFIDVITTHYTFEKENVVFLQNPTKADIIGTLHKMRSYLTNNDNLLIFYAGHGYWDEGMGVGYWLPSDSEKDNPVNWFSNTDLTNYLAAIKTKHTLLIADACFSGGIFKTRNAFDTDMAVERLYQLPSRKAITSGSLKEVPDKSVFIEYLIKRLKDNELKYFTTEQLFSQMRIAVMNNSENVPQYGTIKETGDEGGDFIFIKR